MVVLLFLLEHDSFLGYFFGCVFFVGIFVAGIFLGRLPGEVEVVPNWSQP